MLALAAIPFAQPPAASNPRQETFMPWPCSLAVAFVFCVVGISRCSEWEVTTSYQLPMDPHSSADGREMLFSLSALVPIPVSHHGQQEVVLGGS